ncbi:MAG: NAD(P)H-dependent oxidoreductase [Gammaproteobacteria bacterium]|nr:NAD(P)H-dependent oxidoreductase [Gammaproteobacteria bacterium]MBT8110379.1 NAD(P)H-dependent oxidoreductase [Gammaproteobacteria bacterium]NNC57614.1 FMN-dependent NADH-azoreductase [Woeseiaceae bacterium]NNL45082.1 FMN-dependent NADH-azoreductase [Woeseiaceae bacterium]
MKSQQTHVLEVNASGRIDNSASRALTRDLIAALDDRYGNVQTVRRDLAHGVPFVDAEWIEANFTPDDARTETHRKALALSDSLVAELRNADVLIIGTPVYNFSIPAALKAWIDMIARARMTFRYTENGPKGLLEGKKAYLIVATGGVPVGSDMDFATPYLKHALAFVGITDVEIIAADRLNSQAEESMDAARAQIAELVHLAPQAA